MLLDFPQSTEYQKLDWIHGDVADLMNTTSENMAFMLLFSTNWLARNAQRLQDAY
jgi:hypothetical protein